MNLKISEDCSEQERNYIKSKLIEYNLKNVPSDQNALFEPLQLLLRDENGNVIGGLLGEIAYWRRLNINIFWIDENFRKFGLGKKLLRQAEQIALEKGCRIILLDTFSFQAPDFYIKNGYEIYATLEDCPEGFNKYFLKKILDNN